MIDAKILMVYINKKKLREFFVYISSIFLQFDSIKIKNNFWQFELFVLGKHYKKVPNYNVFSLKGTNVAKRSIEYMNLSKPFNVGYSVTLRSKSMTEPKTCAFHVIYLSIYSLYAPQSSQKN
jgi:hypothetical protein